MLGHATSRLRHQEAHATSLEEIDRLIINITQLTRAEALSGLNEEVWDDGVWLFNHEHTC